MLLCKPIGALVFYPLLISGRLLALACFIGICWGSALPAFAQEQKNTAEAAPAIVILVPPNVLDSLEHFLKPGETLETFSDFGRAGNYRDLTDYILLRQVLQRAGNLLPIVVEPWLDVSYDRVLTRLRKGGASVFSNGIWREDISPDDSKLKASAALFGFGEMEAGLYMSPANAKRLTTKSLEDVHRLSAVSSDQWLPDWKALESLGLTHVYNHFHWEGMMKMVYTQRVDFMLIGFSDRADLSYQALGIRLEPVPGMKVRLAGSRGWAVSLTQPAGRETYRLIEAGLARMRAQGAIRRAYEQAGVINARVANWQVINQLPDPNRTQAQLAH